MKLALAAYAVAILGVVLVISGFVYVVAHFIQKVW
jgi:hypothetical protein